MQGEAGVDIYASYYDATNDKWSLPRQLTHDEHAESALSLACDGTRLVTAYLKTQTALSEVDVEIGGQTYHLENVPQPAQTDLYVLRHTLGHDLAVRDGTFGIESANPQPGTTATLRVTIENRGDMVAENVAVAFYDNGNLIGAPQSIPGVLGAGSAQEVTVAWLVPNVENNHTISVMVDPELLFEDRDRSNNTAALLTVLPDLNIATGWSDPVSPTHIALVSRIENTGVITSGASEVSWHLDAPNGQEIGRTGVVALVPGGAHETSLIWDTYGVVPGRFVQVFAVADTTGVVAEADESNNAHAQSVFVPVACPTDLNGDRSVDLADLTTLLSHFGIQAGATFGDGDVDGNGNVDLTDLTTLLGQFGSTCP